MSKSTKVSTPAINVLPLSTVVRRMKKAELVETGTALGLDLTDAEDRKTWDILAQVIAELKAQRQAQREAAPELTDEQQTIVDSIEMGKSEKMRLLYDTGLKASSIGRAVNGHISFVYTVIGKHVAKLNAPVVVADPTPPTATIADVTVVKGKKKVEKPAAKKTAKAKKETASA